MKAAPCLIALALPVFVTACRDDAPAAAAQSPPVAVRTMRVASGLIPLSAVVEGDGLKARVFAVERIDGVTKAKRLDVTLKQISPAGTQASDSLPPNAEIVTTGAEFLADGAPVLITNDTAR